MIKTISAALLAVSVLAAPAMAGTVRGAGHAAPAAKSVQVKPSVLNANAKMGRHTACIIGITGITVTTANRVSTAAVRFTLPRRGGGS